MFHIVFGELDYRMIDLIKAYFKRGGGECFLSSFHRLCLSDVLMFFMFKNIETKCNVFKVMNIYSAFRS